MNELTKVMREVKDTLAKLAQRVNEHTHKLKELEEKADHPVMIAHVAVPKTLRNEFAMAALGGMLAHGGISILSMVDGRDEVMKDAYLFADASMKARETIDE